MKLKREASLGNVSRGHDQQSGEARIVADVGARVAIAVVGSELGGVLVRSFRPAVELEKKSEPRSAAAIATVAVRAEASACARRCTAPLLECIVASAFCHLSRGQDKGHKDGVCAQRVGELPKKASAACGFAKHTMMSGGGG